MKLAISPKAEMERITVIYTIAIIPSIIENELFQRADKHFSVIELPPLILKVNLLPNMGTVNRYKNVVNKGRGRALILPHLLALLFRRFTTSD